MMHFVTSVAPALVLGLALSAGPAAFAHSLKELESELGDKEKYFQPLEKESPNFTLRDANGKIVRLADYRGKIVVLHFIYARCPDVCPLHAERIAEIQEMVNQTPMKEEVRFVTITTDPLNDTTDVLRGYGPTHGLDPVNWTLLTTTADQAEDATRRLAEAYGHKFTETEAGYQMHGVVTHVIDREGRWRANFRGLRFETTNLVLFINALVNDHHGPAESGGQSLWDKVREFF